MSSPDFGRPPPLPAVEAPHGRGRIDTVETHRGNILEKSRLHSVPELILYAVRKGIIS